MHGQANGLRSTVVLAVLLTLTTADRVPVLEISTGEVPKPSWLYGKKRAQVEEALGMAMLQAFQSESHSRCRS